MKAYTDKELEDAAWNAISNLKTCSQGHIISHLDIVNAFVKCVKKLYPQESDKNVIRKA